MLLTISTTCSPATDLGHVLGKKPACAQSADMSFGKVHIYYPDRVSFTSASTRGYATGWRSSKGASYSTPRVAPRPHRC